MRNRIGLREGLFARHPSILTKGRVTAVGHIWLWAHAICRVLRGLGL